MPSRAATPREEHKPYYGIVRPINDDFWIKHMPPSAWNCLCGVEQTDDEVTPVPAKGPKAAPGLDHNPGLTGKLFSDSHPLSIKANSDARRAARIEREAEALHRKALRKNALETAKANYAGKTVEMAVAGKTLQVRISVKGLKEAINQPHRLFGEKLTALSEQLEEMLREAKYLRTAANTKGGSIRQFHYYEIVLAGEPSFVILKEDEYSVITFYSITDKIKTD